MIDLHKVSVMGRLSYKGKDFFRKNKGSKDDRILYEILKKDGFSVNESYTYGNGLAVMVFESEEEIYICFRGTNFFSVRDWLTNLRVYVGLKTPSQFSTALRLTEKFECYKNEKKIYLVGHSLGGAIASYVAEELSFSVSGVITINGCGIAHLGLQRRSEQHVFHLINKHDWLNKYMRWLVGFGRKLDQIDGISIYFEDNEYNSTLKAHGDWSVFMKGANEFDKYYGSKKE